MSRAYETSLTNRLARLDRWIAESEVLASSSRDDETVRHLQQDLVRFRELRRRTEVDGRRIRRLNRLASGALAAFIGSNLMLAIAAVPFADTVRVILVVITVLMTIASGMTYVGTIVLREIITTGRQLWRFSLQSLIVAMTLIAILLCLLTQAFGIEVANPAAASGILHHPQAGMLCATMVGRSLSVFEDGI